MHGDLSQNKKSLALLDLFIHDSLKPNGDILHRTRSLIGLLVSYSVICIVTSVIIALTISFDSHLVRLGSGLTAVLSAIFITLLVSIKTNGRFVLHTHFTVATFSTIALIAILVSGGPLNSPATALLSVPPILAFCLLERRQGMIWFYICGISLVILVAADLFSIIPFFNLVDPEYKRATLAITIIAAYTAIVLMVLINDSINRHYKAELNQQNRYIEHLANHDQLTMLYNRGKFNAELGKVLRGSNRRQVSNDNKVVLFYIDLNGFKAINDTYGHNAGDELLRIIASRLRQCLRSDDIIGRLGGDEFAILSLGLNDDNDFQTVSDRLLRAIAKPVVYNGQQLQVSGSIGIAVANKTDDCADALRHHADSAMYVAKKQGTGWHLGDNLSTESVA
jgi:diguanylate cyclase (GGDEF)-like protein